MSKETTELLSALTVIVQAARLAPLNYNDHMTVNRAAELLKANIERSEPNPDEEAARV